MRTETQISRAACRTKRGGLGSRGGRGPSGWRFQTAIVRTDSTEAGRTAAGPGSGAGSFGTVTDEQHTLTRSVSEAGSEPP